MSRIHLETIGKEKLRKLVDQTGLTVTALAERCGITRSGFNVWLLNGKLPIKQLEKILVIAAFKNAEISDKPEPIQLGDKTFIPDFVIKPEGESNFLTVEVKLNGVTSDQLNMLQKVGVDAVVSVEGESVKVSFLSGSAINNIAANLAETRFANPLSSSVSTVMTAIGNTHYSYLLRPSTNGTITMELPMDLTAREAERLSLYIKSLVSSDGPSPKQQIKKSKSKARRGTTK